MIKYIVTLCMLVGLATASPVNAECGAISCDNVLITELYTEANGRLLLKVDGTMSNLNCTLVSGASVTLSPTSLHFKPIYASLLAYQLVRHLVSVRIQEGSNGCLIEYINAGD